MIGGACGDAEACLSSGSFFDLDPSIMCDTDDKVCCRPAPSCSAVSLDGSTELQGKCVGKSYCESQQKVSLDGICAGGGDIGVRRKVFCVFFYEIFFSLSRFFDTNY